MKDNIFICIIFLFLLSIVSPANVWAHASLTEATPPPNAQLEEAPQTLSLKFNERLEIGLYYIRVYGEHGEQVTSEQAKMSDNQQEIRLNLPQLKSGVYSVNYKVISADGHPIEETYVISIGDVQPSNEQTISTDEQGHQHENSSLYIIRMLYYLSMLSLTGWLFWGVVSNVSSSSARDVYIKWLKYLKSFLLLMIFGYGFLQFKNLLNGLDINELQGLLFGTTFGLAWTIMAGLALIGLWVLQRSKWIDAAWISLLFLGEAFIGHAITFQPSWYTTALDFVHLVAAAIWVSGLLMIFILWKNHRDFVKSFLPQFSTYAFASITALIITGSLLTLAFTPKLALLWETLWGKVLLLKIIGVLLVIIVGYLVRKAIRSKNDEYLKKQTEWDFGLMVGIVLLVGILTYSSPLPTNEPVFWEETKNNTSIQVEIGPGNPGMINTFSVQIDMENEKVDRKHVSLELIPIEEELAPIDVPIEFINKNRNSLLFSTKGRYLSLPGKWEAELRIRDQADNETIFTDEFTVYPVKKD